MAHHNTVQVVERRREQAAEVVEPRLEQAAEMNPGWMHSELPCGSLSDAEKAAISTQGAIIEEVAGGFFSTARMAVGSYRQDTVLRMFNS